MEENEIEYYTLTDENGNETEYELLATCEKDGNKYYALIPSNTPEESEYLEYVILKLEKEEGGEEFLVSVDDDDEFESVADYFDDLLAEEIDYDAEDEN
ncbi:MAG: DUF1292 domain-containing protein [Clostridia bacterium]|nr:DUF1292 domain-containing protein [Clostridia bacterium]